MSAPIPRDPRELAMTPEQVDAEIARILSEPAADSAEQAEQLDRAHRVLRDALQEN